jgi:PAS domain S-box-containing protein
VWLGRWLLLPWILLPAAMAAAYLSSLLGRVDYAFYDSSLPSEPAPSDIVIVAIDDASLEQLGRWPWPRTLHAALLERLRTARARVVGLDILFTEPDSGSPTDDATLAAAISRGPPTVLPLLAEFGGHRSAVREALPIPILAEAAAGLGHTNLEVDPDGIVRSVYLREGLGAARHPYLALAVLEQAREAPQTLPGERRSAGRAPADVWVRDHRILIPFSGPPGHFAQLSYADVLNGHAADADLAGKIVLVGVTAEGIGDTLATPRSGQSRPMAGVEVMANVLQALRTGTAIRSVPMSATILIGLLPLALVLLALPRLPPRHASLLVLGVLTATVAGSLLALRLGHWWWPPSAALAAIVAAYPLYSWQRLVETHNFLEAEIERLAREPFPLLKRAAALEGLLEGPRTASHDFLIRRIELARHGTERLRNARRLLTDTIDNLPDATLLVDATGRIVLVNPAVLALLGFEDRKDLEGLAVDDVLYKRTRQHDLEFSVLAGDAPCTKEVTFPETDRHFLARAVPYYGDSRERLGTLVNLADVTTLHAMQQERDDLARFLSHDMKSPAVSLLGLAQLQRDPERALSAPELSRRLDLLAQRMLTLLEDFVALTRAESLSPGAFETFDLRDAMQDAYDEVWAAALARKLTIESALTDDEPCLIKGDRHLLARAIVNMLTNAIKLSPTPGTIRLSCERQEHLAAVAVRDWGPGFAAENEQALFKRFSRGLHRGNADPGGAGLGLAFVRVVAEKHHGRVSAQSDRITGTTFRIILPIASLSGSEQPQERSSVTKRMP